MAILHVATFLSLLQVFPPNLLGTFPTDSTATEFCSLASKCQHVRKVCAFP